MTRTDPMTAPTGSTTPARPRVSLAPLTRETPASTPGPSAQPTFDPAPVASDPAPVASDPAPVASEPPPVASEPPPVASEPPPVASTAGVEQACELLRTQLARILAVDLDEVPTDQNLTEMGVDSVFRMELAKAVEKDLGIELTSGDLYAADTLDGLAVVISDIVAGAATVESAATPHPATAANGANPGDTPLDQVIRVFLERVLEQPLDPTVTFEDNGLTSMQMLRGATALETKLGRGLSKTLLYDHPTSADLATWLRTVRDEARLAHLADTDTDEEPLQDDEQGAPSDVTVTTGTSPSVVERSELASHGELAATVSTLEAAHGKEIGLAGRDIAPWLFISAAREGYLSFGRRGSDVVTWSYVGPDEHFEQICAEFVGYTVDRGWRPNVLSLQELDRVGPYPMTTTPFGAMQRLEDLSTFNTEGSSMSRLRSAVARFGRLPGARTVEYRPGSDKVTDAAIGRIIDAWAATKNSINPYVHTVREEIVAGRLGPRQRVFLGMLDDDISHVVIIAKMPAVNGYLLDLEFYPGDLPRGGLEHAIVTILGLLREEGCTSFSFGASFGAPVGHTANPASEVVTDLEELRRCGILGDGNFKFKNKFRPVNVPLYLCQLDGARRTSAADVVLMIADPSPSDAGPAAPAVNSESPTISTTTKADPERRTGPPTVDADPGTRRALLTDAGWNVLRLSHGLVPADLVTDSWMERADDFVLDRLADLTTRAITGEGGDWVAPSWMPHAATFLFPSGRAAEAALTAFWPGRRGAVLHDRAFPTWLHALVSGGFEPTVIGSAAASGDVDLDRLRVALERRHTSFVLVEPGRNSGGGRPMSTANLRAVRDGVHAAGGKLVMDATRIVANALSSGATEPWATVTEQLGLADAVTISASKEFGIDGGGLLATGDPELIRLLRQQDAATGSGVPLLGRRRIALAVEDRDWVLEAARGRIAAVEALRSGLEELPVDAAGTAHCVLLDVGALTGNEAAWPAVAAHVFEQAGARLAPHLDGGDPELAGRLRLAVPVGMDQARTAELGRKIAAALRAPEAIPALLATTAAAPGQSVAEIAYRLADTVPDDLRAELDAGYAPVDGNWAVIEERVPGAQRRLLDVEGGQAEVFDAGTGEAVLFVPPFNIGAGIFAAQVAALAEARRVIVVHHPGVGRTRVSWPVTLPAITAMFAEILDRLELPGPVNVVGASFGSLLAQNFVLDRPERCASLALICGSFRYANRSGAVNRLEEVLAEDFDAIEAGGGRVDRAAAQAQLMRCESMDPRTGLQYLDVFADEPDLRDRLEKISVPTLVLAGRHDSVIPQRTSHLLHGLIERSQYLELPDAGHFPSVTHAEEVTAALTAFLDHAVSAAAKGVPA